MGEIKDVINWFDDEPYKPECYSIKDKMSEIKASPKAGAILAELMAQAPGAESRGDVAESVKDNPNLVRMMGRMTLESMLGHMKDSITEEQVKGLNRMLQQIKKGDRQAVSYNKKNVKKRRHIREFGLNRDEPFSLLTTALYFYSDNRSVTSRMPSGRKRRNNFGSRRRVHR